jgi:hypothetical protein
MDFLMDQDQKLEYYQVRSILYSVKMAADKILHDSISLLIRLD